MKLMLLSDLHLEGDPSYRPPFCENEKSTVLILAGDICELYREKIIKSFLMDMCDRFQHVIYVAGNHEFYNGHLTISKNKFKKWAEASLLNLHFLDNSVVSISGYTFIGCTLWTDYNNGNPIDMLTVQNKLNDYTKIRYSNYTKIKPMVLFKEHIDSKNFIIDSLKNNTNCIVITHHAPSSMSVSEEYKGNSLNSGYFSDLSELIWDYKPLLWCHGHMHSSFDYMLHDTRVVCNPKGYTISRKTGTYYENENYEENKLISL